LLSVTLRIYCRMTTIFAGASAHHVGARSDKAFDLLEKIGRDCIGAVQLTVEREPPPNVHTIDATPIDEAGIEQLLVKTSSAPSFGSFDEDDDFRISLAGAQVKTALLNLDGRWMRPHNATPSTHILKAPLGEVPRGPRSSHLR